MKEFLLTSLLVFHSILSFADTQPRSVDASQFDVAGIKLGMTKHEAISVIQEKWSVSANEIEFETLPTENLVTPTKEEKFFVVSQENRKLRVSLMPRVPYDDANPTIVSQIIYETPWTQENVDAIRAAALEKYGSPSNGKQAFTLDWCKEPSTNPGIGCGMYQGAVLRAGNNTVTLHDPSYRKSVMESRHKQLKSKPMF